MSKSITSLLQPSSLMVIMVPLQPNPWSKISGHPEHQPLILAVFMHTTTTLGNGTNKSRLITAISSILDQAGITVEQATTDADTFVSTALEPIVLVGTDADLLVMLVARTPPDAKLFLLRPSMNTTPAKVFNISAIQQAVGDRKQNLLLLFFHAITGCDITSALYGQGKKGVFRLLSKKSAFQDSMSNDDIPGYEVKVFNSETSSSSVCYW